MRTSYQDDDGRHWAVLVPPGQEAHASMGIPLGPPDVSSLGLPRDVATRLHNELFSRGLIEESDLKGRAHEVVAALQAAYRADAVQVMGLYAAQEGGDDYDDFATASA